jgi:hypothetical protein
MESFSIKGKAGIRAQMFNTSEKKLEMDFILEGDSKSTHILNAVSPAWTASFALAEKVEQIMEKKLA